MIATYEHLISYTILSLFLIFEKTWSTVRSAIEVVCFNFFSNCARVFCELDAASLLPSSFYS